jgi:hypothetical protein
MQVAEYVRGVPRTVRQTFYNVNNVYDLFTNVYDLFTNVYDLFTNVFTNVFTNTNSIPLYLRLLNASCRICKRLYISIDDPLNLTCNKPV